jgi:hypothetical protein
VEFKKILDSKNGWGKRGKRLKGEMTVKSLKLNKRRKSEFEIKKKPK